MTSFMRIHNRFGIDESMWVRITSDGKGTEEPIKFWPHMHRNIPREPGVYQVHITPCEDDWSSPAIYDVNCPCDVYIDGQGLMWNASDDSMTATSQRKFTTRFEQYFLDLEKVKRNEDSYLGMIHFWNARKDEKCNLYLRLSGQDGSSEEFVTLDEYRVDFARKANFLYFLEISYKPEPNTGNVYLIPVNDYWRYNIKEGLYIERKGCQALAFDKFRSAGEDDPKFMNSNEISLKRSNEIVLLNLIRTNSSTNARISAQYGGSEEYKLIKKYDSSVWSRDPGTYYLTLEDNLLYTSKYNNFVLNQKNNYLIFFNGSHIKTLDGRLAPHVTQFRSTLSPNAEFDYSFYEAHCK